MLNIKIFYEKGLVETWTRRHGRILAENRSLEIQDIEEAITSIALSSSSISSAENEDAPWSSDFSSDRHPLGSQRLLIMGKYLHGHFEQRAYKRSVSATTGLRQSLRRSVTRHHGLSIDLRELDYQPQ